MANMWSCTRDSEYDKKFHYLGTLTSIHIKNRGRDIVWFFCVKLDRGALSNMGARFYVYPACRSECRPGYSIDQSRFHDLSCASVHMFELSCVEIKSNTSVTGYLS